MRKLMYLVSLCAMILVGYSTYYIMDNLNPIPESSYEQELRILMHNAVIKAKRTNLPEDCREADDAIQNYKDAIHNAYQR